MSEKYLLTIYNASAGSGKTTTLIKEILKLCIDVNNEYRDEKFYRKVRQIIGLTFTNAVANELKERLVKILYESISDEQKFNNYKKVYFEDVKLNDDEIKGRLREVLKYLLHNYSDLSIFTIDSFSNRVLKSFAKELGYSENYEITNNTEEYYDRSVEIFFESITDEQIKSIVSFIESEKELKEKFKIDDFSNQIKNILSKLVEKELSEKDIQEMKEKINNLDFDLTEEIKKHKEYVEILNNEIRNKLLLYDGELFKIEDGGITDILEKIAENKVSKFYRFIKDPFSVKEYIEKFNVFKGDKKFVNDEINKFLDVIKQKYNYEFLKTQEEQLNILKTIKSKINLTKISLRLLEILQDIKVEENVMFFSDFTKKISEIIQNEENVDFIFEKVGTRYRHFLIDEFQDTSELQFQNLLPLLHNAMAEGNENFIVGDPKQSIYRWRNASIKQCIDLFVNKDISLKKLKNEWQEFKDKIKTEKLEFNYRSAKEIVEFNNDVFNNFEYKEEYESIKKVFRNCNQKVGRTDINGYVELAEFKNKKDKDKNKNKDADKDNKIDPLKIFSDYAFSVINDCISKGFQQKDICILARENKHINIIIENLKGKILCNGEELQFESAENGNLIKSEKVEFIVAFLNLLLDNQNKIANAICIKYYERKSFSEIINVDENFLKKFNDEKFKLYFDTSNILNVDIFQLIMRIIDYFEIEFDPSVQKLLSVANTFMHQYATQNNTIQGFLQFWNEKANKISININKETNAVKIMTIHKSKGLEFPVVIYYQYKSSRGNQNKNDNYWYKINEFDIQPYNDKIAKILDSLKNIYFYLNISDIKNINSNDASVLEEEKILEELNLIYVAYTRAINRLHVFVKDDVYFPKINDRLSSEKYSQDDSKSENYRIISYGNSDFQKQSLKTFENTDIDISDIQLKYNHNILIADSSNPYSDAHELGIKVHKVLELLNDNNLDKTLKKAYIKGYINHSDIEKIRHIILPLLENSELKRYFESENIQYILSEIEIFGKDKETYRPDKLIFTKDKEIVVLEFKSGKEEDKHKQQLKNYIQLISELYNDFKVKGFLLYLREDKILIKKEE